MGVDEDSSTGCVLPWVDFHGTSTLLSAKGWVMGTQGKAEVTVIVLVQLMVGRGVRVGG